MLITNIRKKYSVLNPRYSCLTVLRYCEANKLPNYTSLLILFNRLALTSRQKDQPTVFSAKS